MKKNILFPILYLGLALFIVFFAVTTYRYYQYLHSDDPIDPYIRVMEWGITIVRGDDLAIDMWSGEIYEVIENDIIITRDASYALLNWPDRSKTRLWPNGRMTINRMRVSRDYSSIEIELDIEQWKVWTNVVRTIYPGSYFRAKLPEWGIIAWVRWTTFDINLERSYILSVDHSIALSDGLGRKVTLLPWEAVSAKNILEKISLSVRDAFWNEFNQLQDASDRLYREARIHETLDYFSESSRTLWWRFVAFILSWFDAFRNIELYKNLSQNSLASLSDMPEKYLLEVYQHFQDSKFVQERDAIRMKLIESFKKAKDPSPFIDALSRSAIWDTISFSWMSLSWANLIITEYTSKIDARIKNVLNIVPVKELESKAKETLRNLIQ
jgi:hypothetical protein